MFLEFNVFENNCEIGYYFKCFYTDTNTDKFIPLQYCGFVFLADKKYNIFLMHKFNQGFRYRTRR